MPAAAKDLIQHIRSMNDLLVMQKWSMSKDQWDSTLKGLAESLLAKVCGIGTITVAECTEVCEAVNKSVLTDGYKGQLSTALTARCFADGAAAAAAAPAKAETQLMHYPLAYFTPSDWVLLGDPYRGVTQKVEVVCNRLRAIGCTHPDEQSYGYIAGVVAAVHCPSAAPDSLYSLVLETKAAFHTARGTRPGCVRLPRFPDEPKFLPEEVFKHGYPDADDQPVLKSIDGFQALVSSIPLRKTRKSIRHAGAGSSSQVASLQPQHQQQQANMGLLGLQQLLGGLLQQLPSMQAGNSPPITIFGRGGGQGSQAGGSVHLPSAIPGTPLRSLSAGTLTSVASSPPFFDSPPPAAAGGHSESAPAAVPGGMYGSSGRIVPGSMYGSSSGIALTAGSSATAVGAALGSALGLGTGLASIAGSLVADGSASGAARGGLEGGSRSMYALGDEQRLDDEPPQTAVDAPKKAAISTVDLALRIAAGDPTATGHKKNGTRRCLFKKPAASPAAADASIKSEEGVEKEVGKKKLVLGCTKCRGFLPLSCMTGYVNTKFVLWSLRLGVCVLIIILLPLQRQVHMQLHVC